MDVATAVRQWRLEPHPEGGFFRETYRSALSTVPPGWPAERALATAILFLLPAGARSAWHRVRGDELWLWQGGAAMELHIADETRLVGPDPAAGQEPQVLVPAGAWQSATPSPQATPGRPGRPGASQWSLVACLVTPGFDFADFELR
ncbi:MAG: cupin domain-containing protein [Streptosporangiaceae bacterium]